MARSGVACSIWVRMASSCMTMSSAEVATDRLLATRGVGPVTKPTPSEQRQAEASMRELLASDEFQRVGEVGE